MAGSPRRVFAFRKKTARRITCAECGFREDLGFRVRSSWEANIARYLNHLVVIGAVKSPAERCRSRAASETIWSDAG